MLRNLVWFFILLYVYVEETLEALKESEWRDKLEVEAELDEQIFF